MTSQPAGKSAAISKSGEQQKRSHHHPRPHSLFFSFSIIRSRCLRRLADRHARLGPLSPWRSLSPLRIGHLCPPGSFIAHQRGPLNAAMSQASSSEGPSSSRSSSRPSVCTNTQTQHVRSGSGSRDYKPVNPSNLRESQRPPPTPAEMPPAGHPGYFPTRRSEEDGANETRPLLNDEPSTSCASDPCNHGTFSPRVTTPRSSGDTTPTSPWGFGGRYEGQSQEATDGNVSPIHEMVGDAVGDTLLGAITKRSTTQQLARTHGVRHRRWMFVEYYIPFFKWAQQYSWRFLWGDLIAALTMASFYIPMSLSYASNLGHIPPINGLYAFVFNPLVYAFLGTCPQMVVGPEAAGSLLTGNVVRDSIKKGMAGDKESFYHAQIAGVVTAIAGSILLGAGLFRLGFLDNVLSRPFLRGFISAIGVVIFIDQFIPELGLAKLAEGEQGPEHGSAIEKAIFIFKNLRNTHALTAGVSLGSFAITMVSREIKRHLQPRYPKIAYLPDRFLIVLTASVLAWKLDWESQGLPLLGDVKAENTQIFQAHFPYDFTHMKHLESALSTAFLVSLLGFFESSVAAKSLGVGPSDGIQSIPLSANRELVALGTANMLGGVFMSLPAFGGYGRSKVNASTGGKTPMSSIFLSLITVLCILFLLPAFYYIPKGVLSAMVSVVAWSLIEEAPHDLIFFWKIRGWTELFLAALVFFATILYSLPLGITCGIGFSLLRVIKHATRPRIQILGRIPGTERFENAEANPDRLEFIEGCLIVKIPEPLTFANTGDLRNRLRRLEDYGTTVAHPALPRVRRGEHNKNVIFDIHGVTWLDGAGAQIWTEILETYRSQGIRIFFCRVPGPTSQVWRMLESSGMVDISGGPRHFVDSVSQALRLTELESLTEYFEQHPEAGA